MPLALKRLPKFAPRAPRKAVGAVSSIVLPDHDRVAVRVMNISRDGFMAVVETPVEPGTAVGIDIPAIGILRAVIRWADDNEIGGQFETALPEHLFERL